MFVLGVGWAGLAQVTTGTIRGLITDPTGAVIPNATVVVEEQNTAAKIETKTSTDGQYTVPLLEPGVYSVSAQASGFAPSRRTDVVLEIQQTVQVDLKLAVGEVSERVTVVGSGASPLQTESSEAGDILTANPIETLPLNGRNFSQLALLTPGTNGGAYGSVRASGNGAQTMRAGAEIVGNGGRGSFTNFMIDGIDDREPNVGSIKVFPLVEGIEEFRVQEGNYDAEFAGGGAVIDVTTRAGSNTLHGSAFEFLRNSDLDAREFFDSTRPPYHQNQFGGALGGPIQRSKTFFFADYQGYRIHQSQTVLATTATPAERAGDFSALAASEIIYDPNTYNATTGTRTPFANNTIPTNRFDPVGQNLLQYLWPLPNLPGYANNFVYAPLSVSTQDQFDARVDHTISSADSLFVRGTWGRADVRWPSTPPAINGEPNPQAFLTGASGIAGFLSIVTQPSGQGTLQETHIFNPHLVNHFAAGYTRLVIDVTPLEYGLNLAAKIGLIGANTNPFSSSMPDISTADMTEIGNSFLPDVNMENSWQINDTIAYVRGAHEMKFGGSMLTNEFSFLQLADPQGTLDFAGIYTNNPLDGSGGDAIADMLLGLPDSEGKSVFIDGVPYLSYKEFGAFAQDQWRVRRNLTLNFGLRYDLFTPIVERYNRQSDFNPATGTILLADQNGLSRGIIDLRKDDFSPRVGFAYTLTPKTVLRAAYGLFFFNEQGTGSSARLFIANPYDAEGSTSCSSTEPCLSLQTDGILPISQLLTTAGRPTSVYIPTADQTSNVQQWNMTVEREVAPNTVIRAAYVASKGTHLFIALNENVAVPGPGPVAPRRPYPDFAKISSWEPRGPSSYNSFQLSAEKHYGHGLWFEAAYTYSKSLDNGGGGNSSIGESRINIQNPRDVRADYGLSSFDYRNRFTLAHSFDLPVGQGHHFLAGASGATQAVLGGWQLQGIATLQSGTTLTPQLASATANTGTFTRPDRICNGNFPASRRSINEWFDLSCFVDPPVYQFGNSGRNIIIGPGLTTYDFALHKDFHLTERMGLTFRSEFFNIFNAPNFNLPDRSIGVSSSGTINSVISNAREIQFALRLHF
jgi:outer membrane receptor protein involved in Fe transport